MTQLQFATTPGMAGALVKALFLPRKGFKQGAVWPTINGKLGPVTIDPDALKRYNDVCQLKPSDEVPLLYPHVMASSLHMQILTHKDFPLKLLGAVHLRNKIVQYQKINVADALTFEVTLKDKFITAKGLEFDFETKAMTGGKVVWESLTTYYKPGRYGQAQAGTNGFEMPNLENTQSATNWFLKKNLGKAYAKVCNDYNPIHVSKIAAKLFGFKRDVAHGMGVLATAIDRLSGNQKIYPVTNDVIFKGPLFLENEVTVMKNLASPARFDIYCGKNNRPSICFSLK